MKHFTKEQDLLAMKQGFSRNIWKQSFKTTLENSHISKNERTRMSKAELKAKPSVSVTINGVILIDFT